MEKLEIKHLKVLQEFSNKAHYEEYNSNPVTMFMWNHYYEIYCDIHDRYVLLLVKYPKHIAWLMPLCEEKYLKEAFEQMKKYSDENHFEMSIHGMNKRVKELSEKWGMFVYYQNKDAQDYVYDIEMHKSLVGKKMQKRRNHYNAFMKEYQERFYFRDLVKDDFEMVMSFLDIWKLNHDHLDDIENEIVGIKTLFQYFNELKIHGGCLFIDGELKGFSMYSALSERMIQMHVEKADNSIRGLSVALLKY
ncbi:MAG: phosphatidylglycerol lysyltransferase domain-containing protein, partial [Traorella sp.]